MGIRNRLALGFLGAAAVAGLLAAEPIPLPLGNAPLITPAPMAVAAEPCDRALPITLPTALQLAQVRPLDVAIATQVIQRELARLEQAKVLWLPTIQVGTDYFRHDGRIQDVAGKLADTSKSSFMVGGTPIAIFGTSDALFAPLAQRQVVRAREADLQATRNDTLLSVAEAYFNVQQARGELAGAIVAMQKADELVRRTEGLAESLAPAVDMVRARAERSRRRQQVESAHERWRTASAELVRLLRSDAGALVEPVEPPHVLLTLIEPEKNVDELIPAALVNRPELASQQALVQATLARLRQERLRPLMPSVLLRGASTNPAGTLGAGAFGGGTNGFIGNFGGRMDLDVQVLWELKNLGFGNRALVRERKAENEQAILELFRTQDRIAAEVARAHAQLRSAAVRVHEAESGLKDAVESMEKSLQGLRQTKTAGTLLLLVVRPQEAVASVQALAQAYLDFYGAVGDYDRAQFRLYRALGQPAQELNGCQLVGQTSTPPAMPAPPPDPGRP